MSNFTDSNACASRQHCQACREDRAFRRNLGEFYDLPGGVVDFACPIDLPILGDVTDEQAAPAPARAPASPRQPPTPEQREAHRLAHLFAVMAQAGYAAAGGTGPCASCGDIRYARLTKMWLGCLAPTGDDPFESICAGLVLLEVYLWLNEKLGDITKTQWSAAQAAMRQAHAAATPPYEAVPGGPGAWLAGIIHETTGADHRLCPRCNARVKLLDELGWTGAALKLPTVVGWLRQEARERKIKVGVGTIARAVRAAFRSHR